MIRSVVEGLLTGIAMILIVALFASRWFGARLSEHWREGLSGVAWCAPMFVAFDRASDRAHEIGAWQAGGFTVIGWIVGLAAGGFTMQRIFDRRSRHLPDQRASASRRLAKSRRA